VSLAPIPEGRIRRINRDGSPVWQLQCPECGRWGDIDLDQLQGKVSVDHTDEAGHPAFHPDPCTFHETRDWLATAELVAA
jgi:hypothetical protein